MGKGRTARSAARPAQSSATVSRVNRMLNYGTGSVAESVREDLAAQSVTADTKE